ncbi:hypothetical protein ACU4GG_19100 [Streptomyces nojiriensis]
MTPPAHSPGSPTAADHADTPGSLYPELDAAALAAFVAALETGDVTGLPPPAPPRSPRPAPSPSSPAPR